MAAFEAFDVVVVPFPFTDREATMKRPALVLSGRLAFNQPAGHSVLAMITSARASTDRVGGLRLALRCPTHRMSLIRAGAWWRPA